MGSPEKEPEKTPKKEQEPIEILSDIDDYQKKMESQWESARSSYQQKIDHLLEEFIEQTKDKDLEVSEKNSHKTDSLFSQAENALRSMERKARELTGRPEKSRVINIDWAGSYANAPRQGTGLVLAAFILAVSLGIYFSNIPRQSLLPYSHTGAVVVEKDKIYISDWFRRTLYVHKASRGLPIISVEAMPNDFLTGLAIGPEKIWSADGISAQILEHSKSSDHPVKDKIDSPGKSPAGLVFDGTDLWSLDNATKKIVRHRGNDIGEIREEYSLPELDYSGLAMADNRMWVLSKKSREIYAFRLGDPVKQTGSYDLDSFLNGATPTSIFIEGSQVWLTTENPSQLLRISKRKILSHPVR